MAKKRDYVAEILEIRTRSLRRVPRWDQFSKRNDAIILAYQFLQLTTLKELRSGRDELLKYIPIGTVASLEGYFRMLIRDLIDYGPPFADRARKLDDVKLDIGAVLSMGSSKVSPGEVVAHLLPLNSLEDINRHLTALIGADFLEALKQAKIDVWGEIAFGEHAGRVFAGIQALYRDRHIYAHELAVKVRPGVKRTLDRLASATIFVYATELYIERLLNEVCPPAAEQSVAADTQDRPL